MSTGALLQLAALGPQDAMLYQPGELDPFRMCVRRHSRFAIDTKEYTFPNGFLLGSTNQMEIPRCGDLLGNVTLEIRLPRVPEASPGQTWAKSIGYVLLRKIVLRIDDVIVDQQERLWYDISDRLFLASPHAGGMRAMMGAAALPLDRPHIVYVPLKLLSCKSHHLQNNFLPLLAMPGSTVRLDIEAETFANCSTGSGAELAELDVRVLVEYIDVDAPERERLINRPTHIVFESTQDVESLCYREIVTDSGAARVPLDVVSLSFAEVNVPTKLLCWVTYLTQYSEYFQYTDDIGESVLLLDGTERFSPQPDDYFQLVQKLHSTRRCAARDNVHVYSFALDATSQHPNGTIDFAKVQQPLLKLGLKTKRVDLTCKAFALCYKVLVLHQGRAKLLYA